MKDEQADKVEKEKEVPGVWKVLTRLESLVFDTSQSLHGQAAVIGPRLNNSTLEYFCTQIVRNTFLDTI